MIKARKCPKGQLRILRVLVTTGGNIMVLNKAGGGRLGLLEFLKIMIGNGIESGSQIIYFVSDFATGSGDRRMSPCPCRVYEGEISNGDTVL